MTLLNELKFALRSLSRAKGLALTVVLTLALGIGATHRFSASSAASCCGRWSTARRAG